MPAADHSTYECHCGKRFKHASNLSRHKRLEHAHDSIQYQCHCGKTFDRKDRLARHELIHNGVEYKCDKCNAKFNRKDNLTKHKRTHVQVGGGVDPNLTPTHNQTQQFDSNLSNQPNKTDIPNRTLESEIPNTPLEGDQDNGPEECNFEEEAVNGALKTVTFKA
ncbi:unnamed protein product, partial [Owenia fusiformis]